MYQVFISYSAKDRPIARALSESLRLHGVVTWSDLDLSAGGDWRAEIMRSLEGATAVIVLITPSGLASQFVTQEWLIALQASKRIIPALAGGARWDDLPAELGHIKAVDLNEDFAHGVQQIVDAVADLKHSGEPPPTEHVDIRSIIEDVVEKKLARLGVDKAVTDATHAEDSALVFVATSFQDDMQPTFDAIAAAARVVGLRAERVKDVPGDYRITDRMLSSIRRARLVVVDLTHERPNVYFELGFARGLGKTVITIMREGTKPHFDVQDWTYLMYADSRPLERDLIERFEYEIEQGASPGGL